MIKIYHKQFINEDTALLDADIPDIIEHLFLHYGPISGEEVKCKEVEMLWTPFVSSHLLVVIWNPIEKLDKFAKKATLPYSEQKKIDFALQLIRNTRDFEQALDRWDSKPDTDKTWANLKLHFRDKQTNLKKF